MRWPEVVETFPEPLNEIFKESHARMVIGSSPTTEDQKSQRVWLEVTVPGWNDVVSEENVRTFAALAIPWFVSKLKNTQVMVGFYFQNERSEAAESLQALGATLTGISMKRRERVKPSRVAPE